MRRSLAVVAALLLIAAAVALATPRHSDANSTGIDEIVWLFRLAANAAKHKQWRLLVGALLVALTWLARTLGSKKFPWLMTDRGGVALHLGLSMSIALSTLLLSKADLGVDSLTDALVNALIAAGGYATIKKLWAPDKRVAATTSA